MKRDITFIIPFRSQETCDDWKATSQACIGTLGSLQNQSVKSWRCIIVCHEPPCGLPVDSRISYITADLPIPNNKRGYKLDKGNKISLGLDKYRSDPSMFYMALDADDRVHRGLCRYVNDSNFNRFIAWNGYVYNGSPVVRHHRKTFDRLCGSVIISNYSDLSRGLAPIMNGHHNVRNVYREEGLSFNFISFPAVMKNISYGGNLTRTQFVFGGSPQRTLKKMFMLRPVTKDIKSNFALNFNS